MQKNNSRNEDDEVQNDRHAAEQKYAENDEMKQRKLKTSVKSRLQS